MKRLIKKAELPDIDYNSNTVVVNNDQRLDENFAYKVQQAYILIDSVQAIKEETSERKETLDIDLLSEKLTIIQSLDENSFSDIKYSISYLTSLIKNLNKQEELYEQYRRLIEKLKSKSDDERKEMYNELTKITQELYNEDFKLEISNAKSYFNQFFLKIHPKNVSDIYNDAGEYYVLDLQNPAITSDDLILFSRFCDDVSTKPQEMNISLRAYLKDYLLKQILGNDYDSYMNSVDSYLNTSSRSDLNNIASITLNYPDLIDLNLRLSSNVTELYRGLNFSSKDDVEYQYILQNKTIDANGDYRFASTSSNKGTAKKFAEGNGQGEGLVLTIQPGTIIYNTRIAGGVFGESEIIIDMQDSIVIDVEEIRP